MDPREHPVHITTLKTIAQSPAHYLAKLEHEIANPRNDHPQMRFGRLTHTTVLGGPPSAVWDGERKGNAWKEYKAQNLDRDIVTKAEVEEATRVANAVLSDPVAAPFLVGEAEKPVEWRMLGRRCATRGIDVLGKDFVADLKTTSKAEPEWFRRQCLRMGYHAQLAWYLDAAASIGRRVSDAYIIAVETKPPYAVVTLKLTQRCIEEGRKLCRLWMERLIQCEEANEWPGYIQSIVELDVDDAPFSLFIDGEDVAA